MSIGSQKTTRKISVASILTAILVIASLGSIILIHTNNVAAASNVLFKEKLRGDQAVAQKTIKEGSTTTNVAAQAFTTISGDIDLCVIVVKFDESTGTYLTDFEVCGPAKLTVANGLSSATFSGTVTGFDFATNEEKTVTVNGHLTATGKVQTTTFGYHTNSRHLTEVFNSNGMTRPASGSLNIGGDITFSTDDATGTISTVKAGTIQIQKN
jgi:hypothetical protein